MKIPDDVKIVVAYNLGGYPPESIEARVRNAGEYPSEVWYSDDQFKVMNESGIVILGSGHFTRTVKTRRVAWDLPEGFEIPGDTKAMLEKFILSISDWRDGGHISRGGWRFHERVGGHGLIVHSLSQLEMCYRVTESAEEIPWSPFEVQK